MLINPFYPRDGTSITESEYRHLNKCVQSLQVTFKKVRLQWLWLTKVRGSNPVIGIFYLLFTINSIVNIKIKKRVREWANYFPGLFLFIFNSNKN